jgi:hypothetical protein
MAEEALNKWNELVAASFAMPSNQCFFVFFFFQFCRLQTLAGHFFHFFGAKFSRIYVRKTTISRFFLICLVAKFHHKKNKSLPVVMPMFVCFEVKAPTCVTYQPSATPFRLTP